MTLRRFFTVYAFTALLSPVLWSQNQRLAGIVTDASSGEALARVHVVIPGQEFLGTITNEEGLFSLALPPAADSVKVSHLGYAPATYAVPPGGDTLRIALMPSSYELAGIVVRPRDPVEILGRALAAIPRHSPPRPFGGMGFYREIIRDSAGYLSVVEAVFQLANFPEEDAGERRQLRLVQGRSSEEVRATRLFEDFHPSGGPNMTAGLDLRLYRPDFLQAERLDNYEFTLEDLSSYDGRPVYVIGFDQRPDVREALARGRIFIDAESYALIRYESGFSPRGAPYRRHLSGADRMFARLLKIGFVQRSADLEVNFRRHGDRWFLSDAHFEWVVAYEQEKKDLDLEFTLASDLVLTHIDPDGAAPIPPGERWSRKQVILNVPAVSNEAFWGENNFLSPEKSIGEVIDRMNAGRDPGLLPDPSPAGWRLFRPETAAVYSDGEDLLLQPLMESQWKDDGAGPMLIREITGDFSIEARVHILGAKDGAQLPSTGRQQGGLMVRQHRHDDRENHLLLSIGNVGNPNMRVLYQSTRNSRSALKMEKTGHNVMDLRIVRQGAAFQCWMKTPAAAEWQLLESFDRPDLGATLEIGPAAYAHFSGDGPKMYPDLLVRFEGLRIDQR